MMAECGSEREERARLIVDWWQTPGYDKGETSYDDEIRRLNAQAMALPAIPDWALAVRAAMPRWGVEMCAHRWLDGLDDLMRSIGQERAVLSTAGRCGDMPGAVRVAAEERLAAAEAWARDEPADGEVAGWLGIPDAAKTEAVVCLVALGRAYLRGQGGEPACQALVQSWSTRAEANPLLGELLAEHTLVDTLQNACGFLLLYRLTLALRLIGGDNTGAAERVGACNGQLRLLWRHDLARYANTRGYLWGLWGDLQGLDADWLATHKPDCAPAARYALASVRQAAGDEALRRWLVGSLLKSTRIWCERALARSGGVAVPDWARDLPALP